MTNYNKGKIYRIICNLTGLTYYGSTCEPTLARRLTVHVSDYKCFKEGKTKKYITSFEVLEGGNYAIVLVEIFPCNTKMELHRREQYYIEGNDCVNRYIPTRTRAEWNVVNRSQILENGAKYRLENHEKILEGQAKYNKENADKIKIRYAEYKKENADKIKIRSVEYNKENADKIRIRSAEYKKKNADKIRIRNKEFRANNPEKIKLRDAKYNLQRKEARLAKLNIPI
jgi:hypothetical protein